VLAYAMVHVFYPVAIAAAFASLGVAYFTQERSKEARRRKVHDAIEQCHRDFLVQIDLGKPEAPGGVRRSGKRWRIRQRPGRRHSRVVAKSHQRESHD